MTPNQHGTKTLAELRALPHLSVSQLKTFIQCPRKYRLQYLDHVLPMFRPIALAFGTAWHEAVGFHLTTSSSTELADRDVAKRIFSERLSAALINDSIPILFDEGEDATKTIVRGLQMLDVFLDKLPLPERVVGVELPFALEIVDPEYGDVLDAPLVGAIDALVLMDGRAQVWEFKTSKRKWSLDQMDYDLQPTAYAMAAEQLGFENPDLILLVATKATHPDVQIEELHRTRADRDDLAVTAQSVVAAIAAGIDHPIRGWQCRGCPYAHACV